MRIDHWAEPAQLSCVEMLAGVLQSLLTDLDQPYQFLLVVVWLRPSVQTQCCLLVKWKNINRQFKKKKKKKYQSIKWLFPCNIINELKCLILSLLCCLSYLQAYFENNSSGPDAVLVYLWDCCYKPVPGRTVPSEYSNVSKFYQLFFASSSLYNNAGVQDWYVKYGMKDSASFFFIIFFPYSLKLQNLLNTWPSFCKDPAVITALQ